METYTRPRDPEARIKYRDERTAEGAENAARLRAHLIATGALVPRNGIPAMRLPRPVRVALPQDLAGYVAAAERIVARERDMAIEICETHTGPLADILRGMRAARRAA